VGGGVGVGLEEAVAAGLEFLGGEGLGHFSDCFSQLWLFVGVVLFDQLDFLLFLTLEKGSKHLDLFLQLMDILILSNFLSVEVPHLLQEMSLLLLEHRLEPILHLNLSAVMLHNFHLHPPLLVLNLIDLEFILQLKVAEIGVRLVRGAWDEHAFFGAGFWHLQLNCAVQLLGAWVD
jgi:hypothetical protein